MYNFEWSGKVAENRAGAGVCVCVLSSEALLALRLLICLNG